MGFNYAKQKQRFETEWKKLRKEYEREGMSAYAIDQMYQFDVEAFRSWRIYTVHTQSLPDMRIDEEMKKHASLLKKFKTLSVYFDEHDFSERYAWVDTIEHPMLATRLKQLRPNDLELLTFLIIEGHSQAELAQKWACSQKAISKRYLKIKKYLS